MGSFPEPAAPAPAGGVTATFRFYEELNDFLPPPRRRRDFTVSCARAATTKHMVEALGVPHTEVELILLNGESVGFDRQIAEGDRIAVYPAFEAFDVAPLLRLRERPLRSTRFVADAHLGGLARLRPRVAATFVRFSACDDCGRVYWEGSHWRRMQGLVDEIVASAAPRATAAAVSQQEVRR